MPLKQKQKLALLFGSTFLFGFGLGFFINTPLPESATRQFFPESIGSVRVVIDFGDGTRQTFDSIPTTGSENLFELTKRAAAESGLQFGSEEYAGLGTLITQIGEKRNGEDRKYWQYWVDGRYGDVGASQRIVLPGEVIEWKFSGDQQP
jgi:hypothetical protein